MSDYKLVIFDLDETLTTTNSGEQFPRNEYDRRPLPGRKRKCRELSKQGVAKAIATNQGGCAFGYYDPGTLQQAIRNQAYEWFGIERVEMCPHHSQGTVAALAQDCHCRKPAPGMLLRLMQWFRALPEETLFVGDMQSDRQTALTAGCHYQAAAEFFGATA